MSAYVDLCDGCHSPVEDCLCDYLAAQRALDGDYAGMKALGWTDTAIDELLDGEITPEDLLPEAYQAPGLHQAV